VEPEERYWWPWFLRCLVRKFIFKMKFILVLAIAGYLAFLWMPSEYKHRYFGMIFQTKTEQTAGMNWRSNPPNLVCRLGRRLETRIATTSGRIRRELRRMRARFVSHQVCEARFSCIICSSGYGGYRFVGTAIFLTIIGLAAYQPGKGGAKAPPVDSPGYCPEYCSLIRYLCWLVLYGFLPTPCTDING